MPLRTLARHSSALLKRGILGACVVFGAAPTSAQGDRVVIECVAPKNPEHGPIFQLLKENEALERVRALLAPVRWPRVLKLELKGCDGESNAWYEEASITVCYEYLDDVWRSASSTLRPPGISQEDAFIGPFVDVFLHEAGHGLFDLLKIPLLGREEDAADQIAAYYMLQFPNETKRRLVLGAAYSYASELKVRRARDLHKPRLEVGRHITYADEHGTPAQRLQSAFALRMARTRSSSRKLSEKATYRRAAPRYARASISRSISPIAR